jgi:hypothetical protein
MILMDRNEYMRNYWKTHPIQYSIHKSNILYLRNVKKFNLIIDRMINRIIVYQFYNNENNEVKDDTSQIILNGKYNTSEKI